MCESGSAQFIDACATGGRILLTVDDAISSLPLARPYAGGLALPAYRFFGTNYSTVDVSSNGYITFSNGGTPADENVYVPSGFCPNTPRVPTRPSSRTTRWIFSRARTGACVFTPSASPSSSSSGTTCPDRDRPHVPPHVRDHPQLRDAAGNDSIDLVYQTIQGNNGGPTLVGSQNDTGLVGETYEFVTTGLTQAITSGTTLHTIPGQ